MTHATIARYQSRSRFKLKWEQRARLSLVQAPTQVAAFTACAPDAQYIRKLCEVNDPRWDTDVTPDIISARIEAVTALYDSRRIELMWRNCRSEVIHSIANTFGVGKLAGALDKTGGNVDTVHNARQGIYATEQERQKFEARGDYNTTDYHAHDDYKATNARHSDMLKNGTLTDSYTGDRFHQSTKNDSQRKPNLDHIVAATNIHNDAGRILANVEGPNLANTAENLTPTCASINKAKGAKTAAEFTHHLDAQAPERKARIQELEAKGNLRTDQERKQLTKLQQLDKVDPERLAQKEHEARSDIEKKINTAYYTSPAFAGRLAASSATEGLKMGMQQAMGEIVVEFFSAVFDEITDCFQTGRRQSTLVAEMKIRLHAIARRCEGRLQAAMHAFKLGCISGFFSNLVTALINTFITTAKRLTRMIREGIFSLVKGIQLLLCPPQGMTIREATHEASKILLAGGIVVGGIAVEEWLEKQFSLIPLLASIAQFAVPALVGSLTALLTTLGVYLIDQADLFGVIRANRMVGTTALIDESITTLEERLEAIIADGDRANLTLT